MREVSLYGDDFFSFKKLTLKVKAWALNKRTKLFTTIPRAMITDKTFPRAIPTEGRWNRSLTRSNCRTTNWLWNHIIKDYIVVYRQAAYVPWWTDRLTDSILRITLHIKIISVSSWQLLAENGYRSLKACSRALQSHHAKGQVCLKFALQCISGDDLDFLSLPPRVQRETASFQRFPSSNYVSSPVNIWHSHIAASRHFPGVGSSLPMLVPLEGVAECFMS